MSIFSQRLKESMDKCKITQSELACASKLSNASISSYLLGICKPRAESVIALSNALNVPANWLCGADEEKEVCGVNKLSIKRASELMGVSQQFIRVGLQKGILPFGYAVKISQGRFTYFISAKKFSEYTGIEVA
ncbi:MAG: helix-turn-helix transcriptional regulator [Oscillospiraceae bacterium]|nr:helix-turn-helix transcriptional regulator [Oscillospiraceae bacterium]